MSAQNTLSVSCPNCGAQLNVDKQQEIIVCQYCGANCSMADLLNESDAVRVEKIKSHTYKDIEMSKLQAERERIQQVMENENKIQEEKKANNFKKSKFGKILIVFAIICLLACLLAFSGRNKQILSGLIALIQCALFTTAWLMGMRIIKEKKNGIHLLIAIVGFLLIIPYFCFYGTGRGTGSGRYASSDNYMEMTNLEWPTSDIAKLLPTPQSNIGNISWERSDGFYIYVGETSLDDYNTYVKACIEKGFDVDYSKGNDYYYADNKDGFSLSLRHDDNVMSVHISAPEEKTTDEESEQSSESLTNQDEQNNASVSTDESAPPENSDSAESGETETSESSAPEESIESPSAESSSPTADGIRPEFKEAMDSYEKFFDEYIEFMNKYSESDNPTSMLLDYASYMAQFTEAMEKMDAVGEDELSTEELLYYTEVCSRINQKLLKVSLEP